MLVLCEEGPGCDRFRFRAEVSALMGNSHTVGHIVLKPPLHRRGWGRGVLFEERVFFVFCEPFLSATDHSFSVYLANRAFH